MAPTLKLEIVTPLEIAFSADVEMVTLPAIEGEMGVYPAHVRVWSCESFVRRSIGAAQGMVRLV